MNTTNSHMCAPSTPLLDVCLSQYIIKPPRSLLSAFTWHRDSDWCRTGDVHYAPYISVWCALDDMTLENGCLWVRPFTAGDGGGESEAATSQLPVSNNGVGVQSDGPSAKQATLSGRLEPCCSSGGSSESLHGGGHSSGGSTEGARRPLASRPRELSRDEGSGALPLPCRAGTVVIFSDTLPHCSGPNRTQHTRRAWMPQFSRAPICWKADGSPVSFCIPLSSGAVIEK